MPSSVPRVQAPVLAAVVDDRMAQITVHELHHDGVRPVGTYADAPDAWAAVDRLDAPVVAMSQPADCAFLVASRSRR
jgi:hypothetical protein